MSYAFVTQQFLDKTKEDVLLNFSNSDALVTAARVALFFALLFSYPVLIHPTRAAINRLFYFGKDLWWNRRKMAARWKGINSEKEKLLKQKPDEGGESPVLKQKPDEGGESPVLKQKPDKDRRGQVLEVQHWYCTHDNVKLDTSHICVNIFIGT